MHWLLVILFAEIFGAINAVEIVPKTIWLLTHTCLDVYISMIPSRKFMDQNFSFDKERERCCTFVFIFTC